MATATEILLAQGLVHYRQGALQEAEQAYRAVIAREPHHIDALHYLGAICLDAGRPQEALDICDRLAGIGCDTTKSLTTRSGALLALGRAEEALAACDNLLAREPASANAHMNRSAALMALRQPGEALIHCEQTLLLGPPTAEKWYNRGRVMMALKRFDKATRDFERALALDPAHAQSRFEIALCRLVTGDFANGWAEYEWRWQTPLLKRRAAAFTRPAWRGEDISDKTLLIHAEQGLGDIIQFARYAPRAAERARRVILEVLPPLLPLLADQIPGVEVVASQSPLPPHDVQCALLGLPGIFKTAIESIPAQAPWISAPQDRIGIWAKRLTTVPQPRVGLVWSGNRKHRNDAARSMPVQQLAPLLSGAARFVSLQKEARADELTWLAAHSVAHFGSQLGDLADTAALINLMDVVISVDTSVAHLAAAMGKPTWILLPYFDTDWRWMVDRDDSPWYPTACLFRQPAIGDWESVIVRVADALATVGKK